MDHKKMICAKSKYETRDEDGEKYIEGYFALFNAIYDVVPGAITESISPGAFRGALAGDVRALTNHDSTLVLGRTKAGTLTLREDDQGLWGRIKINQQDADALNLYHRVQRGDVDQCSFGFDIVREDVEFSLGGIAHWTIREINPLYEVTVATFPAYRETYVYARTTETEAARKRIEKTWRTETIKKLKGE